LKRGIPDEAFDTLPDDDKEVAAELRKKNKEERKGYQSLDFAGRRTEDLDALRGEFTTVANLPENTPEQIRRKQNAYDEFRRGIHLRTLKTLADIQVAQFYIPKTQETQRKVTTHDQYRRYLRGENPHPEPTGYAQVLSLRKSFFHWFLEFPAIFARGGFDAILGNPPFLGGQRLTGRYGHQFCNWVRTEYAPIGSADLVAYFYRRVFELLRHGAFQGLISTNSIAQGAAREGSLEQITLRSGTIVFAVKSIRWPGQAAVNVSLVVIHKGNWTGKLMLGTKNVPHISSFLDEQGEIGAPLPLTANQKLSYQGSIVLGKGFFLTDEKAAELTAQNPKNFDVVVPRINGQDLNSTPNQVATSWVINFRDMSEKDAQIQYPECFEMLEANVKAIRLKDNRKTYRVHWWQFAEKRRELYQAIVGLKSVIVVARVSKTLAFCIVPCGQVFDEKLVVFALWQPRYFAVLQSTLHHHWAWRLCTTMKSDLTYTPTTIFETFPFPLVLPDSLDGVGSRYHEHRRQLMLQMQLGLTKTYNLFHDPHLSPEVVAKSSKQATDVAAEAYSDLLKLRELHRDMDNAVLAAYGWHQPSDDGPVIDLCHDFYEVDYLPENDRTRYTIHPDARRELLKRLLLLNHKRHAEEQAEVVSTKEAKTGKKTGKRSPKSSTKDDRLLFPD
jgi:hypothetical protein